MWCSSLDIFYFLGHFAWVNELVEKETNICYLRTRPLGPRDKPCQVGLLPHDCATFLYLRIYFTLSLFCDDARSVYNRAVFLDVDFD